MCRLPVFLTSSMGECNKEEEIQEGEDSSRMEKDEKEEKDKDASVKYLKQVTKGDSRFINLIKYLCYFTPTLLFLDGSCIKPCFGFVLNQRRLKIIGLIKSPSYFIPMLLFLDGLHIKAFFFFVCFFFIFIL
jgi:hypothetical protein